MSRIKNAHATIHQVREDLITTRARIRQQLADKRITPEVAAEQRRAARDDYQARLRAAEADVKAYIESATSATETARAKALAPAGGLEGELAASRIWARHKRLLDGLTDSAAYAMALNDLGRATAPELVVLSEELPAYLEARGHRRSDVKQHVDEAIDAVVGTDPEYDAARAYQAHAERVVGVLRMNASAVGRVVEYDEHDTPDLKQPQGYGDPALLRLMTATDPTVEAPPRIPGAHESSTGWWDTHDQAFVSPAAPAAPEAATAAPTRVVIDGRSVESPTDDKDYAGSDLNPSRWSSGDLAFIEGEPAAAT